MKRTINLAGLLFCLLAMTECGIAKDGHSIKIRIKGIADTAVYLANYYGPKLYYVDTAAADAKGLCEFNGEDTLPGGIYAIIFPDRKNYFEFVVTEQQFYIETSKDDILGSMKVKGSKENTLFFNYLRFIDKEQGKADALKKQLSHLEEAGKSDSVQIIRGELRKINEGVKAYKLDFMEQHKGTFVAKIFKASKDPDVPDEVPVRPDGSTDSLFKFHYFKKHYLDGIDFSDSRLIRSPVLHNKVVHYIKKLTMQTPDSINAAADFLVEKARANKEVFKYLVHYITSTYEKSKIMGMDAVFVHMAEKYYMAKECFWMDSTQLAKLTERAITLRPLLIGKTIPNLTMQDTSGKWHILHEVKSKFTVLYIWDPDCGHCKKETPKLKTLYDKFHPEGVEVYAVSTPLDNKEWIKYLREHTHDWIDVSDSPEFPSNFRDIFDVYSTPIIYLLDARKKILAKRLSVEQLEDFLSKKLKK